MNTKICTKCNILKPINAFYKDNTKKDGLHSACKTCVNILRALYYKNNRITIKNRRSNYYKNNKEKCKQCNANWVKNNYKKDLLNHKYWDKMHPKARQLIQQRYNKKRLSTPEGKLNRAMSVSMWQCLGPNKSTKSWKTLVNYTLLDLKKHLESQFYNGMTWDSFKNNKVHIHHIKEKHTFKFKTTNDPEFKECWALSNLRPMWRKDHIKLHSMT